MENRRVEILTFHWTINFGGLLQAFALQETLKKLGFCASFINYHNKAELASVSSRKRRILQVCWDKIARIFFGRKKRETITNAFRKQYLQIHDQLLESYDALVAEYDGLTNYSYAYIVGSDQVWNPNLTGNPSAYLLSFLPKDVCKIAYAASFGKASLPQSCEPQFIRSLPLFRAISVREDSGAKLIKKLSGITAPIVMDPVFLLSADEWKVISSQRIVKEEYVVCYYMNTPDKTIHKTIASIANELAHKYKLKIINIGKKEYEKMKVWEKNLFDIGPSDFLSLIAHAQYVVTNSFHATAFSCIFHIPFFVPVNYEESEENRLSNRMESLARKLGCTDRIVSCNFSDSDFSSRINKLEKMNFEEVDKAILKYKDESIAFLNSALSE